MREGCRCSSANIVRGAPNLFVFLVDDWGSSLGGDVVEFLLFRFVLLRGCSFELCLCFCFEDKAYARARADVTCIFSLALGKYQEGLVLSLLHGRIIASSRYRRYK